MASCLERRGGFLAYLGKRRRFFLTVSYECGLWIVGWSLDSLLATPEDGQNRNLVAKKVT